MLQNKLKKHFKVKLAGEATKENLMLEGFNEDITMGKDLILEVIKEENLLIDQKFSVLTVEILGILLQSVQHLERLLKIVINQISNLILLKVKKKKKQKSKRLKTCY